MHNKTPDYRHPRLHINWPYLSHIWFGKCIRLMDTSDQDSSEPRHFGTMLMCPDTSAPKHFRTETLAPPGVSRYRKGKTNLELRCQQ